MRHSMEGIMRKKNSNLYGAHSKMTHFATLTSKMSIFSPNKINIQYSRSFHSLFSFIYRIY